MNTLKRLGKSTPPKAIKRLPEKDADGLLPRQRKFVEELLVDGDLERAYIAAGYEGRGRTAIVAATKIARNITIKSTLNTGVKRRNEIAQADLIEGDLRALLNAMISADPTRIVRATRCACRYCYGIDFQYQETAEELRVRKREYAVESRALKADKKGVSEFEVRGGTGWRAARRPHPDCPECGGEGVSRMVIADMDRLTPEERRLVASIKQEQNGSLTVKFVARERVLELGLRVLGMLKDKVEVSNSGIENLAQAMEQARQRFEESAYAKRQARLGSVDSNPEKLH